jgi:hypothetical protein
MDIIKSSKGRDKVFALIQYTTDLYVKCMASSADSSPFNVEFLSSSISWLNQSSDWRQYQGSNITPEVSNIYNFVMTRLPQQTNFDLKASGRYRIAKNLVK